MPFLFSCAYATLIIAVVLLGVGNEIEKVPLDTSLSTPKSKTITALLLLVLLYIKAPLAVKVAEVQEVSLKSIKPVVPDTAGSILVNVLPPAVYPVPVTSPVVVYAVVVALRLAEEVYNAILKVLPPEALKSCSASSISFLNELQSACVIAIMLPLM
jgi:hypothetical protein